MPTYIWAPIAVLALAIYGLASGGLIMGIIYRREYKLLINKDLSEREPSHDKQVLHDKGLALASIAAAVFMMMIGTSSCWVLYNLFVLLLKR